MNQYLPTSHPCPKIVQGLLSRALLKFFLMDVYALLTNQLTKWTWMMPTKSLNFLFFSLRCEFRYLWFLELTAFLKRLVCLVLVHLLLQQRSIEHWRLVGQAITQFCIEHYRSNRRRPDHKALLRIRLASLEPPHAHQQALPVHQVTHTDLNVLLVVCVIAA